MRLGLSAAVQTRLRIEGPVGSRQDRWCACSRIAFRSRNPEADGDAAVAASRVRQRQIGNRKPQGFRDQFGVVGAGFGKQNREFLTA